MRAQMPSLCTFCVAIATIVCFKCAFAWQMRRFVRFGFALHVAGAALSASLACSPVLYVCGSAHLCCILGGSCSVCGAVCCYFPALGRRGPICALYFARFRFVFCGYESVILCQCESRAMRYMDVPGPGESISRIWFGHKYPQILHRNLSPTWPICPNLISAIYFI